MAWRGNSFESGAEAVGSIHLEVEDLKVQINDLKSHPQGDDDDVGNQLLGWERRLGQVERSIENVWIRIGEELFWIPYMSWRNLRQ